MKSFMYHLTMVLGLALALPLALAASLIEESSSAATPLVVPFLFAAQALWTWGIAWLIQYAGWL